MTARTQVAIEDANKLRKYVNLFRPRKMYSRRGRG